MDTAIVWLRRDLRLDDNPALATAVQAHRKVVPVYIHCPEEAGEWAPGAASNWWLHHSLAALEDGLHDCGSRLVIRHGPSLAALQRLLRESGAGAVYWNRLYEPAEIERDRQVKQALRAAGIEVSSSNAGLWQEPWSLTRSGGQPYRVFTAYWKALQRTPAPPPQAAPPALPPVDAELEGEPLASLGLLPTVAWDEGLGEAWRPGEANAVDLLGAFLATAVEDYPKFHDRPDLKGTSALSPYLHFGEIGPRRVLAEVARWRDRHPGDLEALDAFVRQLAWRDFAHHVLFHFPHTTERALNARFDRFPWRGGEGRAPEAWCAGETGIPIVDAGMRQLWRTGWMHNRVRMIVGSLLTKHLLWHWRDGARWFWDTLVDADLANNTLGWQWIAGCGADAAPYFRVFNPLLQAERFDPHNAYLRRWLPELAGLPDQYVRQPWEAPPAVRARAGVRLGENYPQRVIDLAEGRRRALQAYGSLKRGPGPGRASAA